MRRQRLSDPGRESYVSRIEASREAFLAANSALLALTNQAPPEFTEVRTLGQAPIGGVRVKDKPHTWRVVNPAWRSWKRRLEAADEYADSLRDEYNRLVENFQEDVQVWNKGREYVFRNKRRRLD